MAEASVHEGMVNYNQFMPVAAKTIEIMCEPKALRQRAELIEKTDLSANSLLHGMSTEEFQNKLTTLFKSYDVDKSGLIDRDELKACLSSFDFEIPENSLSLLLITSNITTDGSLTLEGFVKFFSDNLLMLEKERQLKLLQESVHKQPRSPSRLMSTVVDDDGDDLHSKTIGDFNAHLTSIFELADTDNTGFLPVDEVENILNSLEVDITSFQLECLFTEIKISSDGKIHYAEFIPVCADLLEVG